MKKYITGKVDWNCMVPKTQDQREQELIDQVYAYRSFTWKRKVDIDSKAHIDKKILKPANILPPLPVYTPTKPKTKKEMEEEND